MEQKIKGLNISLGGEDDMTSTLQKQSVNVCSFFRSRLSLFGFRGEVPLLGKKLCRGMLFLIMLFSKTINFDNF